MNWRLFSRWPVFVLLLLAAAAVSAIAWPFTLLVDKALMRRAESEVEL